MSLDLPIDEDLLGRLPLPLAQLYRRAHNAKTALEQHLTSFYLWEAAIKLLGTVAVAEHAADESHRPHPDALKDLSAPALGHWWEFLRLLLPRLAAERPAFQAIRQFLYGPPRDDLPRAAALNELLLESVEGRRAARSTLRPQELFENLIDYRKREIGHAAGAERAAEFHERMARALLTAFSEVAPRLDVLAGRRLTYLGSLPDGSRWVLRASELRGDHPVPADLPRLPDGKPPEPGRVYLTAPGAGTDARIPVQLHPLVRFDADAEVMFFLTARASGQGEYLCYTTGQKWSWPVAGRDWEDLLPRAPRPFDERGEGAPTVPDMGAVPPKPAPPPVFRNYQLLGELGRGGMGVVYRAWQPSLGRQVALKVIHSRGDEAAEARFLKEVEALGRVDHPNLVRIYESGTEEGRLFYAMEFLEGDTLQQHFRRADALPAGREIGRAVDLVRQVAALALESLHRSGILHRDVKPQNIMVTADGSRAVLLDLGVARQAKTATLTTTGGFAGTVAYASPELLQLGRISPASDVYSLGVSLWEVLAGKSLFGPGTYFEVARRVVENDPEPIRKYNAAVPIDLEAVVLKCLQKEPRRRYATADALAEDLRRWLDGLAVSARPAAVRELLLVWVRRNRALVATASLAVLLAALASVASFFRIASERDLYEAQRRLLEHEIDLYKARAAPPDEAVQAYEAKVEELEQRLRDSETRGGPSPGLAGAAGFLTAALLGAGAGGWWLWRGRSPAAPAPAPDRPTALSPTPVPAAAPAPEAPANPEPAVRRRRQPGADEAFSSQTVVLRYPAPIAIAYRRFCARREPRDRLAQLFDTFEITLKYLVYLGLADLCRCRLKAGPPYEPLPERRQGFDLTRRRTRMTLGQWARSLRECADALAKEDGLFVPELPEVCGPNGFLEVEIIRWIGANRNAATHRHGGISLTSEKCEPLLREARPKLERLLQEIAFLRRYPLGFVTAGHPLPGDRRRYRVHSCMGARVAFGEEVYPMETKLRFPEGVPFVVAPDESAVLCLWPFLLQRESDFTQRPALYVFEEIDGDRRFLTKVNAAAIDHDDVWPSELHPSDADDHGWLWEALAKLPQTVPATPELRLAEGLAESLVGRLSGESLGEGKHYKLLGPIARGGFGTVYDAVDLRTDTRVAVKVLEDHEVLDAKDDRNQFRRFQQEYEKLKDAGAEHPGIVRCFEWGADIIGRREYPWYSMEFAAGGDLNDRLHERRAALKGRAPWDDPAQRAAAVEEFRAVAAAVAHLHDSNVIHRDVKPGNVLVMEGGDLRLSDFGLIKELERSHAGASGPVSSRGAVLGTRDYMAPEQERGDAVTKAADVYALGVVLAELLGGERPQPDRGLTAGSPLEHDVYLDRLPEPLRRLVLQCTDVDPERRPPDAHGLLHLFELALRKSQT